jgi:hypothetical protein
MYCPSCATQTDGRFCPNCGAAVPAGPAAAPQPPPANPYSVTTTAVADPSGIRNWAMGAHLASLIGIIVPFGNIIGPLVIWLIKKDESPIIDREGKESLNFQISMTIYMIVAALMIFILIGIPILFVLVVLDVVLAIVAAVKASNGQPYRYPMTIRFLR